MHKTHKPVGPKGVPKSRPIVGATRGLTTALGEMISDVIEPIARVSPEQSEAQSTEELMREIEETNKELRDLKSGEGIVVASMDVSALYPSLDQRESAKIVRKEFEESGIEIEGVDWRLVALYLAVTVSREELLREGLEHLVAKRRKMKGRKPTVHCPGLAGPMSRQERKESEKEDSQWQTEDNLTVGERLDLEVN